MTAFRHRSWIFSPKFKPPNKTTKNIKINAISFIPPKERDNEKNVFIWLAVKYESFLLLLLQCINKNGYHISVNVNHCKMRMRDTNMVMSTLPYDGGRERESELEKIVGNYPYFIGCNCVYIYPRCGLPSNRIDFTLHFFRPVNAPLLIDVIFFSRLFFFGLNLRSH